jgi:ribosomal protein L16/L10AE
LFRKLPYTFTTKKPLEVRMGKGKGNHADWICPIKIGQILIEFSFKSLNFFSILNLLRKCLKRLPVKSNVIAYDLGVLPKNADRNFNLITK